MSDKLKRSCVQSYLKMDKQPTFRFLWRTGIILVFILTRTVGQPLEYHFTTFTVDDGLSQNSIFALAQDQTGRIWMGTGTGIDYYNGNRIKTINESILARESEWFVRCLLFDQNGHLWIGTESGILASFDPLKMDWVYRSTIARGTGIRSLQFVENGILVGTWGSGIYYHDNISDTTYSIVPELKNAKINRIIVDSTGTFWVATNDSGLYRFTIDSTEARCEQFKPATVSPPWGVEIYDILPDDKGRMWIGSRKGLTRISSKGKIRHFTTHVPHRAFNGFNQIANYGDKLVLGLVDNGIALFSKSTGKIQHVEHVTDEAQSLPGDKINAIFVDHTKEVWIGTWGGGVTHFNPAPLFEHINTLPYDRNSISNSSVRAILLYPDSVLWVGSYGGLDRYGIDSNTHDHYTPNNSELSNINVYCLLPDRKNIWVGTEGGGLFLHTPDSQTFKSLPHPADVPGKDFIFAISDFTSDEIVVGTHLGIDIINRHTGVFRKSLTSNPAFPKQLQSQTVQCLYLQDSVLWVGTATNGVFQLKIPGGEIQSYSHYKAGESSGLIVNRIKCIIEDVRGNIWVGTQGGGLARFNGNRFVSPIELDLLPSKTIYGICEDKQGYLWLSTNQGILRYDDSSNELVQFVRDNGLQENEFNTAAFYQAQDGKLYFGGINGITSFYPHKLLQDIPPKPVISEYRMATGESSKIDFGGDTDSWHSLSGIKTITMSMNRGHLALLFSSPDYHHRQGMIFAYRLAGLEESFQETTGDRPFTSFTHLPPGSYNFILKSRYSGSQFWSPETQLAIFVPTPFWRTRLAYLFYVLSGICISVLAFHYYTRHDRKLRAEQQEKIKQLERIDRLKQESLLSKEKYQHVFNQSADPIFIVDKDGFFEDLNKAGQQLLDIHEDLSTHCLFDLFSDETGAETLKTELDRGGEVKDLEFNLTSLGGNNLVVLISGTVRKVNEKINGYQGNFRDITMDIQRNVEIRRLLSGLEAAGESMVMTDVEGQILYVNPAFTKITGFSLKEAIGKTPAILNSGQHTPDFFKHLWSTILSGKPWSGEITNRKKNGKFYTASLTIAPWKDLKGNIGGFVAIHTDITRRLKMEKDLKRSRQAYQNLTQKLLAVQDNERERISRDIHDSLGQYLAALALRNDIIQENLSDQNPVAKHNLKESRKLIHKAIKECRRLSFELNPLSLQRLGLIQAIRELISTVPQGKKLKIHFDHPENLDLSSDIGTALYRVCQEALSNMTKYSEADKVDINLEERKDEYVMSIKDNGKGFDMASITYSGFQGSGILNMQERIYALGGKFSIKSHPHEGVNIDIRIPRRD